MRNVLKRSGAGLPLAVLVLVTGAATPAWAGVPVSMPVSGAGILAGAAIIGAIVIAKLWRRR